MPSARGIATMVDPGAREVTSKLAPGLRARPGRIMPVDESATADTPAMDRGRSSAGSIGIGNAASRVSSCRTAPTPTAVAVPALPGAAGMRPPVGRNVDAKLHRAPS